MDEKQKREFETALLPRVERPGRYCGGEINSVAKDPAACDVRMALIFPDVYEVGMSHLGFTLVYHLVNGIERAACERAFAPWPDMEAELRKSNMPLCSLETGTPLCDFDIVGFTLAYEMGYTNVLTVLDLGGITLRASDRGEGDPLVIAGGCCTFNPEPVADFFDMVALGDGEELVPELIECMRAMKRVGASRADILLAASKIKGIYVPSLYKPVYRDGSFAGMETAPGVPPVVNKRIVEDLDAAFYPAQPIVPGIEAVQDRGRVEIFRGCTRGCRFCHAGMVYRPIRERSPEKVAALAKSIFETTGCEEISLLSFNATDYAALDETLEAIDAFASEMRASVSLPSTRLDTFTSGVGKKLRSVRPSGLTFAPEAGSQRLRDVINKQLSEEEIFNALDAAFRQGWTKVKLYFMIGLPGETDEDIDAIAEMVERMQRMARRAKSKRGKSDFTVSVSTFVPKAHTPFQWHGMDGAESLDRKQKKLVHRLRSTRVKLNTHDIETSVLEGVMSRGDRRISRVIETAWKLGCRFDGWTEQFKYDLWKQAFAEAGLDPDAIAMKVFDNDAPLPWEHINCGVTRKFLMLEKLKSERAMTTEWCENGNRCHGCGLNCKASMQGRAR